MERAEGQTIGQCICIVSVEVAQERIVKLQELRAPEIILKGEMDKVVFFCHAFYFQEGCFKINGDAELLKVPFEDGVWKKGRGGKCYVAFNDETVLYFPNGKYGPYITIAEGA